MSRGAANLTAVLVALALALFAAAGGRTAPTPTISASLTVRDALGTALECRAYQRVVSLSILSDALLVELLEPERLIAGCAWSQGAEAFKLGARPRLRSVDELEAILALKPDLVIVSTSAIAPLTRLRAAGIAVYEMGDLTGWTQCAQTITAFGRLLRVEERARRLLTRSEARLAAVAAHPPPSRPRALWVSVIGDRLYGGTVGTSYHDLLVRAGCIDAAAGRYRAWPEYSLEDLLTLDAELLVTAAGQAELLRRRAGGDRLRSRIIELPEAVAGDPGLGLIEAVELLRAALE